MTKPQLSRGQPTKEEFQAWRDQPVTQWVTKALEAAALAQREHWLEESWNAGKADPMLLTELRSRADAYMAIADTEYQDWCEFNGDDPLAGEAND